MAEEPRRNDAGIDPDADSANIPLDFDLAPLPEVISRAEAFMQRPRPRPSLTDIFSRPASPNLYAAPGALEFDEAIDQLTTGDCPPAFPSQASAAPAESLPHNAQPPESPTAIPESTVQEPIPHPLATEVKASLMPPTPYIAEDIPLLTDVIEAHGAVLSSTTLPHEPPPDLADIPLLTDIIALADDRPNDGTVIPPPVSDIHANPEPEGEHVMQAMAKALAEQLQKELPTLIEAALDQARRDLQSDLSHGIQAATEAVLRKMLSPPLDNPPRESFPISSLAGQESDPSTRP